MAKNKWALKMGGIAAIAAFIVVYFVFTLGLQINPLDNPTFFLSLMIIPVIAFLVSFFLWAYSTESTNFWKGGIIGTLAAIYIHPIAMGIWYLLVALVVSATDNAKGTFLELIISWLLITLFSFVQIGKISIPLGLITGVILGHLQGKERQVQLPPENSK